jgi:hypothetical protein
MALEAVLPPYGQLGNGDEMAVETILHAISKCEKQAA